MKLTSLFVFRPLLTFRMQPTSEQDMEDLLQAILVRHTEEQDNFLTQAIFMLTNSTANTSVIEAILEVATERAQPAIAYRQEIVQPDPSPFSLLGSTQAFTSGQCRQARRLKIGPMPSLCNESQFKAIRILVEQIPGLPLSDLLAQVIITGRPDILQSPLERAPYCCPDLYNSLPGVARELTQVHHHPLAPERPLFSSRQAWRPTKGLL